MKICSQCQTTYTDDGLQFCLQDGKPLNFVSSTSQMPTAEWNSEPETVIKSDRNQMRIDLPPPQVEQPQTYSTNPQSNFQPEPSPKKSKVGIFVVVGLLGLLAVVAGAVVGVVMYMNSGQNILVQNNNVSANNSTTNNSANNSTANANATPTATATPTPTPKPTLKPAEIESAKKEAESAIYGWKAAAENHNLDTNISSYADSVDYYKGGKVNKSKLKASKEPAYKKYDAIEIDITNMKVSVDPTGEKATVTFDKTWDFSGVDKDGNDVMNSGSVQQQLILNKIGGKWKIVSEKDLKVYYVDKGSNEEN